MRLITRPAAYAKGQYQVLREDFSEPLPGLLALWVPDAVDDVAQGRWLKQVFAERCGWRCSCIAGRTMPAAGGAAESGRAAADSAVASGDVHMHARGRRALQDTMTAIRHHVPVAEAGLRLHPNGERHLRSLDVLRELYPQALLDALCNRPALHVRSRRVALSISTSWCQRDTRSSWLRQLTEEGIALALAGGRGQSAQADRHELG
jgi:error-prone DNA polymerase